MTITSKEIATRLIIAVGTVLSCNIIGGLIGAAVLPLVGIPDGFITGALSGSIAAIAFLISDWS